MDTISGNFSNLWEKKNLKINSEWKFEIFKIWNGVRNRWFPKIQTSRNSKTETKSNSRFINGTSGDYTKKTRKFSAQSSKAKTIRKTEKNPTKLRDIETKIIFRLIFLANVSPSESANDKNQGYVIIITDPRGWGWKTIIIRNLEWARKGRKSIDSKHFR